MNLRLNKLLLFFIAVFVSQYVFAQKMFHCSIQFPSWINVKNVKIQFNDGIKTIPVSATFIKNKILISGKGYSKFVTLDITYPKNKTSDYYYEYFLKYGHSSIIFPQNDSLKNVFEKCELINAVDVTTTSEFNRLKLYAQKEINNIQQFSAKNENQFATNDSLNKLSFQKTIILLKKYLEFIEQNGNDYYYFWFYRLKVFPYLIGTEPLHLEEVFNEAFPERFKQSIEGKEIQKTFAGLINTKEGSLAPNFTTKGTKGEMISLKNYRGKYVLLQFWASWCQPCMAELPQIKEIYGTYSGKNFVLISISSDTDSSSFYKCINKNKMDWPQIFNSTNVINRYGNKAIPSVYLIDKEGKIIYSSWENNFETLDSLLSKDLSK